MMAMAFRQILEPPRTSELCLEDVLNLRKRYPQRKRGKTLNWAVACGSAVKFLLDADRVQGSIASDRSVVDDRVHKDLEIVLFTEDALKHRDKNPHDLFGVDFWGPLQDVDYDQPSKNHGIYIEALRDHYFGFQPTPTTKDTLDVYLGGNRFTVLSPEFLIASKLFSTIGIREGRDDVDVMKLLQKFKIKQDYLADLLSQTKFKEIVTREDLSNLEQEIKSGKLVEKIFDKVTKKYASSVPEDLESMPYNNWVSLLNFLPNELRWSTDPRSSGRLALNNLTDECRTNSETNLAFVYLMSYFPGFEASAQASLGAEKAFSVVRLLAGITERQEEIGFKKAVETARCLRRLKKAAKRYPEILSNRDELIYCLTNDLFGEYFQVRVAQYDKALGELEKGRLETFEQFWRQRYEANKNKA